MVAVAYETSERRGDQQMIAYCVGELKRLGSEVLMSDSHAVTPQTAASPDRCGVLVNGHPCVRLAGHADRGSPSHDTRVKTTMNEQTPEEAEQEAQAAAEMGMDIETYREREARHSDFQPRVVGHIDLSDIDLSGLIGDDK
jgi:hypothetical protein